MIRKCCVCRRVEEDGRWIMNILTAAHQMVTHVYCPQCFEGFMDRIERQERLKASKDVYTLAEAGGY